MRCASSGLAAYFAAASNTGMPSARFGTKWLSIMSTWTQSAVSIAASSSPKREKSAARMEGEIIGADMPTSLSRLVGCAAKDRKEHGVGTVPMRPHLHGFLMAHIAHIRNESMCIEFFGAEFAHGAVDDASGFT